MPHTTGKFGPGRIDAPTLPFLPDHPEEFPNARQGLLFLTAAGANDLSPADGIPDLDGYRIGSQIEFDYVSYNPDGSGVLPQDGYWIMGVTNLSAG